MWITGGFVPPSSTPYAVQDRVNARAVRVKSRMGSMVEEEDRGVKSQRPLMLLVSPLK
jgi:hypothetical protein